MVCTVNKPYYIPQNQSGIRLVISLGDANNIEIYWYPAYVDNLNFNLAYNVYFSTEEENVFLEGPKFLSTNLNGLYTKISGFTPGDTYYFAVRATEYQSIWYNPNFLPDAEDGYMLKVYPETLLAANISNTSTIIPITDINLFPPMGVIQVGYEYIRYDSKDIPNSTLLVAERGFLNTNIRSHTTDGYDGYDQLSPIVRFFQGCEEVNTLINEEASNFNYNNFAYTLADGYREETKDLLTTDLSFTEAQQIDFPVYPQEGWRRTDLDAFFKGQCLDTYFGGESGCADGYNVGNQIRNVSISDINDQRQEFILNFTGEPVVLVKRLWKGIRCSCYEPNKESAESRCPNCYGSSFVTGFEQFYNPRRSDGRIMVRFGPYTDDVKQEDSGLESIAIHDCRALTTPVIKDRDFIIRFNEDGTEEYRYEVLDVTRNKIFYGVSGVQNFKAQRIRKTDPIYSWRAVRSTATMPNKVNTSVGLLLGPNNTFIPHTHQIVLNENITALSQVNQTTSMSNGHNHPIINGVIQPSPIDGHTHQIINF